MNFVVIGTDHRFQTSDPGFDALVRSWAGARYVVPLSAIAEEYHEAIGISSIGKRVAQELGLEWFNVDMSAEERERAGILTDQLRRPISTDAVAIRVPSDTIREDTWVSRLTSVDRGTVILICGYLHYDHLAQRLRAEGHTVDRRVYLETVPEIRFR